MTFYFTILFIKNRFMNLTQKIKLNSKKFMVNIKLFQFKMLIKLLKKESKIYMDY